MTISDKTVNAYAKCFNRKCRAECVTIQQSRTKNKGKRFAHLNSAIFFTSTVVPTNFRLLNGKIVLRRGNVHVAHLSPVNVDFSFGFVASQHRNLVLGSVSAVVVQNLFYLA
uniref:Uncharacterized protein n=1 Tax=Steinernema glaseri TaxID=37863 RepID=A0A1I8AT62_9BILA